MDHASEIDYEFPGTVLVMMLRIVGPLHVDHRVAAGQRELGQVKRRLDLMHDGRTRIITVVEDFDPNSHPIYRRAVVEVCYRTSAAPGDRGAGRRRIDARAREDPRRRQRSSS